jgi:hypothetical protein
MECAYQRLSCMTPGTRGGRDFFISDFIRSFPAHVHECVVGMRSTRGDQAVALGFERPALFLPGVDAALNVTGRGRALGDDYFGSDCVGGYCPSAYCAGARQGDSPDSWCVAVFALAVMAMVIGHYVSQID